MRSVVFVVDPPNRRWLMRMKWHDLLFAHWPVPTEALRPLVPAGLSLDTFDGTAWVGVVPFWMSGIRARFTPALPWVSRFAELNVRTYVTAGGRPGVWFFSLDAEQPLAVRAARWLFHLPYFDARMEVGRAGDWVEYRSIRTHRGAAPAEFVGRYRPVGPVRLATPGSLDQFLTDRLCLYAADRRSRLFRGDIEHTPWPLQPAEAEIERNSMTVQIGLELPPSRPLLHFSKYLSVKAWRIVRVVEPEADVQRA